MVLYYLDWILGEEIHFRNDQVYATRELEKNHHLSQIAISKFNEDDKFFLQLFRLAEDDTRLCSFMEGGMFLRNWCQSYCLAVVNYSTMKQYLENQTKRSNTLIKDYSKEIEGLISENSIEKIRESIIQNEADTLKTTQFNFEQQQRVVKNTIANCFTAIKYINPNDVRDIFEMPLNEELGAILGAIEFLSNTKILKPFRLKFVSLQQWKAFRYNAGKLNISDVLPEKVAEIMSFLGNNALANEYGYGILANKWITWLRSILEISSGKDAVQLWSDAESILRGINESHDDEYNPFCGSELHKIIQKLVLDFLYNNGFNIALINVKNCNSAIFMYAIAKILEHDEIHCKELRTSLENLNLCSTTPIIFGPIGIKWISFLQELSSGKLLRQELQQLLKELPKPEIFCKIGQAFKLLTKQSVQDDILESLNFVDFHNIDGNYLPKVRSIFNMDIYKSNPIFTNELEWQMLDFLESVVDVQVQSKILKESEQVFNSAQSSLEIIEKFWAESCSLETDFFRKLINSVDIRKTPDVTLIKNHFTADLSIQFTPMAVYYDFLQGSGHLRINSNGEFCIDPLNFKFLDELKFSSKIQFENNLVVATPIQRFSNVIYEELKIYFIEICASLDGGPLPSKKTFDLMVKDICNYYTKGDADVLALFAFILNQELILTVNSYQQLVHLSIEENKTQQIISLINSHSPQDLADKIHSKLSRNSNQVISEISSGSSEKDIFFSLCSSIEDMQYFELHLENRVYFLNMLEKLVLVNDIQKEEELSFESKPSILSLQRNRIKELKSQIKEIQNQSEKTWEESQALLKSFNKENARETVFTDDCDKVMRMVCLFKDDGMYSRFDVEKKPFPKNISASLASPEFANSLLSLNKSAISKYRIAEARRTILYNSNITDSIHLGKLGRFYYNWLSFIDDYFESEESLGAAVDNYKKEETQLKLYEELAELTYDESIKLIEKHIILTRQKISNISVASQNALEAKKRKQNLARMQLLRVKLEDFEELFEEKKSNLQTKRIMEGLSIILGLDLSYLGIIQTYSPAEFCAMVTEISDNVEHLAQHKVNSLWNRFYYDEEVQISDLKNSNMTAGVKIAEFVFASLRLHAQFDQMRADENEIHGLRSVVDDLKVEKLRLIEESQSEPKTVVELEKAIGHLQKKCSKFREIISNELKEINEVLKVQSANLNKLDVKEFSALLNMNALPIHVSKVFESVLFLSYNIKTAQWRQAKRYISTSQKFTTLLRQFNVENISQRKINVVHEEYIVGLNMIEIQKQSTLAANLLTWMKSVISYHDISNNLQPKQDQLRELYNRLMHFNTRLTQMLSSSTCE